MDPMKSGKPLDGGLLHMNEKERQQWVKDFAALHNPLPRPPQFDIGKLTRFAQKRGIPTNTLGWENAVLLQAAAEHDELKWPAKRGRPSKSTYTQGAGLLSDPIPTKAELKENAILAFVESLKAYVREEWNGEAGDIDCLRVFVRHQLKTDPESEAFGSLVRSKQLALSRARRRQRGS